MKHWSYIVLVLSMGFSSCSSQKILETKTPFIIGSASCQEWIGGREESGSGLTLKVPVSNSIDNTIIFRNVYFRGKMTEVYRNTVDGELFVMGKFVSEKIDKPDIVMHADSTQEVGNQPPKLNKKNTMESPFELKNDEAVLSYIENGTEKYVKISGIQERPALIYQSKPKN
ncbi:MAG: hypothetical protein WBG90_11650 [Saonia sp.]